MLTLIKILVGLLISIAMAAIFTIIYVAIGNIHKLDFKKDHTHEDEED